MHGLDRKLHWFLCVRALGLEEAYAPALGRESFEARPWLGCVEVYMAWQSGAAAGVLASLAAAGLLRGSAGQPVRDEAEEQQQQQLACWLSASLTAFEASLALEQATERGDVARMEALLQQGSARVDVPLLDWPPSGDTCLHVAAGRGHAAAVVLLLERQAQADAPNYEGASALHRAAAAGSAETASLLLGAGAAVGAATSSGATALHLAAGVGRLGVVKLLLARGADAQSMDRDGSTPLEDAHRATSDPCCGGDAPGMHFSGVVSLLETLRKMPADARRAAAARSWELHAASALQDAATSGNLSSLALLLASYSADVDAVDYDGTTALHAAAEAEAEATVSLALLLSAGADVGAADPYGNTPLHAAARSGGVEAAELLLSSGADWRVANVAGRRAVDVARAGGHEGVVALLEREAAAPAAARDGGRAARVAAEAAASLRAVGGAQREGSPASAGPYLMRAPSGGGGHDDEALRQPISVSGSQRPVDWIVSEVEGLRIFEPAR